MSRRRPAKGGGKKSAHDDPTPEDDDALWQHATHSIEPLRRVKARVPDTSPAELQRRGEAVADSGASEPLVRHEPRSTAQPTPSRAQPKPRPPPPLATFERRKVRKIASGQIEIDARLDLHGLRQNEAHQRLAGFLASCAAQGLGTVLVITGKGAKAGDEEPRRHWSSDQPERGVLRRMVPLWLEEPALRVIVVSFTSAAIKHGGDGAFYIRLRRRGRTG